MTMSEEYLQPIGNVTCENLTEEIIASYKKEGYVLTFVEEVLRRDLSPAIPHIVIPLEVSYFTWDSQHTHEFFTVYEAAFRERPGFPTWSEDEWVHWTSDDPAFRPDLSFLAIIQDQVVGFVTNANDEEAPTQDGYIIQIGVHPQWRNQRLGAALMSRSLQAWQSEGRKAVILHVNANNPGAIHLYLQLGFVTIRRRGKFTRE